MTDELQRAQGEPRYLLDHPQPLGILPTRWFWRGNDSDNWRRVRWLLFVPFYIVMVALYSTGNMLLFTIASPVVLILMVGLLEKYIRRQAAKRSRALVQSESSLMLDAERSGSGTSSSAGEASGGG